MLIQLLGMKFKAINDTEALFEQAKGEANNFDELISALRQKLAQREYVQELDANHQTQPYAGACQGNQVDAHSAL